MPWLLNLIYAGVIVAAFPFLLARRIRQGKYRAGWREKLFGELPDLAPADERIWFHAVSVGEVLLLTGLIAELRSRRPDLSIVLTTTTTTGFDVAKARYPDLTVCYCPLDFSWAVARAIGRLKPTALVLAELELWPNLIAAASRTGIRLAVVNGRLSAKSFRGYRKIRPLVSRLLQRFDVIAVQNEEYAARFLELGAPIERTVVTGSVKFDGVENDRDNPRTQALRRIFGIGDDEMVFIAGSTQSPEEDYVLETWRQLRSEFPKLRLILVPRHKERFEEVARQVETRGLPLLRRSRCEPGPAMAAGQLLTPHHSSTDQPPICLLDTLGELSACWGLADVAFVGGSLTSRGGQNMIEPAAYGAAVLFGPNTWNFRDAVSLLLEANAAEVVENKAELARAVRGLLIDRNRRLELGDRARRAVTTHRGATEKTLNLLLNRVLAPAAQRKQDRAA